MKIVGKALSGCALHFKRGKLKEEKVKALLSLCLLKEDWIEQPRI